MTLGPSPLYADVSLDLSTPHVKELPDAAVLEELVAWLGHHGARIDPDAVRAVITATELQLWRRGPVDRHAAQPFPLPITMTIAPLRTHPSVALLNGLARAGVLTCAAVVEDETGRVSWRCNVLVDPYGRHLGPHLDGRFGDEAEWPNMNGADLPPPAAPAPAIALPSLAAIRVVLGLALDLCHHLPDAGEDCPHCPRIDRAAASVHAMIGAPS